jgi:hypothetical protein
MHRRVRKLIHDVVPLARAIDDDAIQPPVIRIAEVNKLPSDLMIEELYKRQVPIERVFSVYYQLEAMGDYQPHNLTVGDAELAGLTALPPTPKDRQPF